MSDRDAAAWDIEAEEVVQIVGGDPGRAEQLSAATDLLLAHIKPERVPAVVRRPSPHLDGRSLLDLARDGQLERVVADLEETLDVGRVQP